MIVLVECLSNYERSSQPQEYEISYLSQSEEEQVGIIRFQTGSRDLKFEFGTTLLDNRLKQPSLYRSSFLGGFLNK